MKKIHTLYKGWAFICLLLTTAISFAASEAEYGKLAKTYTLHADGSQEFRYQMELTLFTHTAMNSTYGESFILYNPAYQTLKINDSYTKQKDGKTVRTPDNAFIEVLPRNAANAPAYNQLKEMVVVHTGLELGATIYLDYTITSKAGYLPELDVFESLLQSSPVQHYTVTLSVPENKKIRYTLQNSSVQPTEQTDNGMRSTTWHFRNLPAASRNPFVSVQNGDQPYLAATTYSSPQEALAFLYKQFNAPDDSQLATVSEALTEGKEREEEQLQTILNYVSKELDNSMLPLSQTGYRLRQADAVINSAYGTEAEKINLLTGLLRAAGFEVEPAALYRVKATEGIALNAIETLFVSCRSGEKHYFLSVYPPYKSPAALSAGIRPAYTLRNGEPIEARDIEDTAINSRTTLQITGEKVVLTTLEKTGKGLLPYFVAAEKESCDSLQLRTTDGYATIQLPDPTYGLAHQSYGRLNSQRKENLQLPYPVNEHCTYTVEIPRHMQLKTPATEQVIENGAGKITLSVKKEQGRATIVRQIELKKQLFTPAEYADLRRLLTVWDDPNKKTLLFSVN